MSRPTPRRTRSPRFELATTRTHGSPDPIPTCRFAAFPKRTRARAQPLAASYDWHAVS